MERLLAIKRQQNDGCYVNDEGSDSPASPVPQAHPEPEVKPAPQVTRPYTPAAQAKPVYSASPQPKPKFVSHSVDMVQEEQFSRPSRPGRARHAAAHAGASEKREEKQKPTSNGRREMQSVPLSQRKAADQRQMSSPHTQDNSASSDVARGARYSEEKQPAKSSKAESSRISRPTEERRGNTHERVQEVKSSEGPRTNYRQVQNVGSGQTSNASCQPPSSQSNLPSRDLPKQVATPSPSEQSLKRGYVEIAARCHVDALFFFPA